MGQKSTVSSEPIKEEHLHERPDERMMVQNNRIHPYNSIGKIVVHFTHPQTKKTLKNYGTAFLITPQHVLTVAHIFMLKNLPIDIQPSKIQFFPEPLQRSSSFQNGIQAQIIHLDQKYFIQNQQERRKYDCAILKLSVRLSIEKQNLLYCNFDYSFDQNRSSPIRIPGYPSEKQIQQLQFQSRSPAPFNNALFYDERQANRQESKGILKYNHSTTQGTSGAPLLLRKKNGSYEVIGLHIGVQGNLNCGMLLKSCVLKQTIKSLTKTEAIQFTDSKLFQQTENLKIKIKSKTNSLYVVELLKNYSKQQEKNDTKDLLYLTDDELYNLQVINLGASKISDAGLKILAENGDKFINLQRIYLERNQITDLGLKVLVQNGHKFSNLEEIYLGKNMITDSGLKQLAENGKKFLNLKVINLCNNKIADAGLRVLVENGQKLSKLESIDLDKNKITDKGLRELVDNGNKFTNLQIIFLWDNQIARAGWISMKERLKNLNFKIETGF